MGTIFFTRHGETECNTKKLVCGARETPLTQKGHEQAIELGNELKSQIEQGKIHIDKILHSPLSRAKMTAQHISEITGIPMEEEPLLIERNFGDFENHERTEQAFRDSLKTFALSFGRASGGESNMRTAQRIYNLLDRLTQSPEHKNQVYLLVAHNGLSRAVNSYFFDMTNEEFGNFSVTNCQLVRYDF